MTIIDVPTIATNNEPKCLTKTRLNLLLILHDRTVSRIRQPGLHGLFLACLFSGSEHCVQWSEFVGRRLVARTGHIPTEKVSNVASRCLGVLFGLCAMVLRLPFEHRLAHSWQCTRVLVQSAALHWHHNSWYSVSVLQLDRDSVWHGCRDRTAFVDFYQCTDSQKSTTTCDSVCRWLLRSSFSEHRTLVTGGRHPQKFVLNCNTAIGTQSFSSTTAFVASIFDHSNPRYGPFSEPYSRKSTKNDRFDNTSVQWT